MRRSLVALLSCAGVLVTCTASAINVYEDKEKGASFNVGVLLQPQLQITKDGAPNGSAASFDFFLRRARLMAYGTAFEHLSFFIETDQVNWGKNGVWDTSTYVQDAFISYEFFRELSVDGGMMLVPLSHHTLEGATSLNALDYHATLIKYPTGAGKVLRDGGVQLRGLLLGDRIHYRVGVFEGVRGPALPTGAPAGTQPLNAAGEPRFAAHVRANILGVEEKFFFNGIYFTDKPLLSVGLGYDYQRHATRIKTGVSNHAALSADVFLEYPLTPDDEIIAKVNGFRYAEGTGSAATGLGMFAEAGFRHAWVEPVVGLDVFHAEASADDYVAFHGGMNFWIKKHTTNVKADVTYGVDTTPAGSKRDLLGTVQWQLFF